MMKLTWKICLNQIYLTFYPSSKCTEKIPTCAWTFDKAKMQQQIKKFLNMVRDVNALNANKILQKQELELEQVLQLHDRLGWMTFLDHGLWLVSCQLSWLFIDCCCHSRQLLSISGHRSKLQICLGFDSNHIGSNNTTWGFIMQLQNWI